MLQSKKKVFKSKKVYMVLTNAWVGSVLERNISGSRFKHNIIIGKPTAYPSQLKPKFILSLWWIGRKSIFHISNLPSKSVRIRIQPLKLGQVHKRTAFLSYSKEISNMYSIYQQRIRQPEIKNFNNFTDTILCYNDLFRFRVHNTFKLGIFKDFLLVSRPDPKRWTKISENAKWIPNIGFWKAKLYLWRKPYYSSTLQTFLDSEGCLF